MAEANTKPDPGEVKNASEMWLNFTALVKYSCVGAAAILLALLLFVY